MERINELVFLAINAGAHPPGFLLATALFIANWLVPLVILLFVLLWVRKSGGDRIALIAATIAMLIGLGVNQVIGFFYFHPRPFMIGLGHQYLPHPPDNSFPSDHATFMWSLGFALLALGALRLWAVLLVAGGLAIAWARVYVGVHFPFDMAGSLLVALVVSSFAGLIRRLIQPWAAPVCFKFYESIIRLCHFPPALFPRDGAFDRRLALNPLDRVSLFERGGN
jgi:undecaprenyl-diphosphatase